MNALRVPMNTEPAVAPFDPQTWQTSLIELLARLDYARYELTKFRLGSDSGPIIDHLEAMIQAAEDLANRTQFTASHSAQRSDTIAKAGAFFMSASSLKGGGGSRSFLISSMFRALSGSNSEIPEQVRSAMLAVHDSLASYFALFSARFDSTEAAHDWDDASDAFLEDFKHLVRKLPV